MATGSLTNVSDKRVQKHGGRVSLYLFKRRDRLIELGEEIADDFIAYFCFVVIRDVDHD